ncbi:MAG: hypothetical protein ABJL55_12405 [Roseibium sp.]
MIPYSLPEPINAKPLHFTLLVAALLVLTSAYLFSRGSYWYKHWQTPYAFPQSQTVALAIGDRHFKIPIGYIRKEYQRLAVLNQGQELSKLGLSMTWPHLAMPNNQRSSLEAGKVISVIEADLENSYGLETLRAQLDPFYRRLARGGEIRGPAGLNILQLSVPTASDQDQIVYDPTHANGFIARCMKKVAWSNATCHRALPLGNGLELQYRFDRQLLPEWQSLDPAVMALIENFQRS